MFEDEDGQVVLFGEACQPVRGIEVDQGDLFSLHLNVHDEGQSHRFDGAIFISLPKTRAPAILQKEGFSNL